MSLSQSNELKTGLRHEQPVVNTFKAGDVVFKEGTTGKELFIVREGSIGLYKKFSGNEVELARIENGGILGEMSLIDNSPRSATAKCLEPSRLIVINEAAFENTLKSIPVWIASIIRIISRRLRDADKRLDQSILRDKDRGIISLMLLLLPESGYEFSSQSALDFDSLIIEAFFVCRIKKNELLNVLSNLEKRSIVSIAEDAGHKKHVCVRDLEALHIYGEYLKLKGQNKKFREMNIPDEAVAVLSNLVYVSQKSGIETKDGTMLMKSVFVNDLENRNCDNLEKSLIDLKRRNLLDIMPAENNDDMLIFDKDVLGRIKKIKEWLPRFEEELS
jgi:CRP-like cAMP-binding protein